MDQQALFKIGYGLYILTARHENRDNGCVVNTMMQVTSTPPVVCVITVNKQNFTHDMILASKAFNVSILSVEAPFEVFRRFGFQSGKTVDKFAGYPDAARSENGLLYLPEYCNAYLSFTVADAYDFGSHTMFKACVTAGEALGGAESVTYAYYQRYIKPKPEERQKSGWRCTLCGYVYEGDPLPEDFTCPICKHGASDFVRI